MDLDQETAKELVKSVIDGFELHMFLFLCAEGQIIR